MKPSEKQRKIRRMKTYSQKMGTVTEKPWLNSEGYHDPTAYAALRNIERAEKSRVR